MVTASVASWDIHPSARAVSGIRTCDKKSTRRTYMSAHRARQTRCRSASRCNLQRKTPIARHPLYTTGSCLWEFHSLDMRTAFAPRPRAMTPKVTRLAQHEITGQRDAQEPARDAGSINAAITTTPQRLIRQAREGRRAVERCWWMG